MDPDPTRIYGPRGRQSSKNFQVNPTSSELTFANTLSVGSHSSHPDINHFVPSSESQRQHSHTTIMADEQSSNYGNDDDFNDDATMDDEPPSQAMQNNRFSPDLANHKGINGVNDITPPDSGHQNRIMNGDIQMAESDAAAPTYDWHALMVQFESQMHSKQREIHDLEDRMARISNVCLPCYL